LPERSTRGKRMRAQLADEEADADADFWNQEFFAEDARDIDYQSEKEEEDVPDSDFFKSESEADDDEEVEVKERRKKTLKPPGAPPGSSKPRAPRTQATPKPPKPPASSSPSAAAAAGQDELPQSVIFEATYEAPTLRKSTRARVEVAQKEREQREQQAKATRRPQRQGDYRVLTQEELLAEAARTELDNLASLKKLLAQEEETKKKANIKKQRFGGPLIRFRSRTIQVLVPPEVAAREQQLRQQQEQQQQQASSLGGAATAPKQEPAPGSSAAAAEGTAAGTAGAADAVQPQSEAVPMQVDQQQQQQAPQQEPQQQPQPEQPTGPVLQRQALNTLQCLGMKAPKWLLPQRAPAPTQKPICPITGTAAHYRDPLTGHYYSSAEAFRELRRRLGQPLPPPQPYRRLAASPAAELTALLGTAAATAAAATAAAADPTAAGAAAGEPVPSVAATAGADGGTQQGAGGLPAGQLQLQELVEKHVQQQLAVAVGKGRGRSQYYQQQPVAVPDEVAALVMQVSQMVHG